MPAQESSVESSSKFSSASGGLKTDLIPDGAKFQKDDEIIIQGISSRWNNSEGVVCGWVESKQLWRVEVDLDGMLLEAVMKTENMRLKSDKVMKMYMVPVSQLGITGGILSCYCEENSDDLCMQYFMGLALAVHCFFLQGVIIYYIWVYIVQSMHKGDAKDAPWLLVVVAIYLHLHNVFESIPAGGSAVWKAWKDRAFIALAVVTVDSIIIPLLTIVLGALFLCTSGDINDLLLNSCAVAFVTYIDNWIVSGLYAWTNNLAPEEEIELPAHTPTTVRVVMWIGFFLPIVPALFCVGFAHIGLEVLQL